MVRVWISVWIADIYAGYQRASHDFIALFILVSVKSCCLDCLSTSAGSGLTYLLHLNNPDDPVFCLLPPPCDAAIIG